MWLITGTIEPQMSRNVADSGLCMSIYVHILACLLHGIALLYITCVTCLTN